MKNNIVVESVTRVNGVEIAQSANGVVIRNGENSVTIPNGSVGKAIASQIANAAHVVVPRKKRKGKDTSSEDALNEQVDAMLNAEN